MQNSENKIKTMWKAVKQETGQKWDKLVTTAVQTANDFNTYFIGIGRLPPDDRTSQNKEENTLNTITNTIFMRSVDVVVFVLRISLDGEL